MGEALFSLTYRRDDRPFPSPAHGPLLSLSLSLSLSLCVCVWKDRESGAVACGTHRPLSSLAFVQSFIQSLIRHRHSEFARKQRISLYSCHCEALMAHVEMTRSASVHIKNIF